MKRQGSMNRIYRLVWSRVKNTWVAVAEAARGRGKESCRKLVATALSISAAIALAAPTGGQVAAGAGSISQSGPTTTIRQTSQSLSLNWQSFNVLAQETVNFLQPSAAAIAVNRIADTNGTLILGHLNANGQVWLINPNGILFGQGAQVNVGGLIASTLNLNDASLNGNARAFSGNGTGSVINQGTITAADGGYVALLGNTVGNQGTIIARLGIVALGAGSAATLTFSGNSLVKMQVDQSVLNSLAENGGLINADGGMVIMNAGAKNALLASVVNNTGVIEARTVENHEGVITLLGGMTSGTVNVGGTLDASAPDGGNGGFIETSAAHVKVAKDVKVTTAAPTGLYGTWLIDPQDYTVGASGDITGATLSTQLGTTPITLQSSGGGTAGSGNVNVNDAVSWSANTTLTLTASNNVNINANITATGNTAGLVINPNTANGAETASGTGVYSLNNGASVTLSGTNPSLSISGTSYTVINALGAMGSTTATDLQGMRGNLARHYALGSNIEATATSGWNGGGGFIPVGQWNAMFTGTLDGLGHSITNLSVSFPGNYNVGLFGCVGSGGTVKNVGLVGGSVTGQYYVGGLVGYNAGSISNSYATGAVTGNGSIGGLVGRNVGSINNSYATGNMTGTGSEVGGLVGFNSASISNSYATGVVTGASNVGGLVGVAYDLSTVSNSHYNIDTVMINGVTSHVTPYGLYNAQYLDWFNNNKVLSIANYASTLPFNNGYYQISTVQGLKDLLGFTDNASYKFRLTANLDLAPIPGWHIPYFAGSEFDGAGYALNNLAVNQPMNSRIGFIGMLAFGSQLGNLGLTNVSVTGGESVGGLVGQQDGTISNSYTTGVVTGLWDYSGGLVGIMGWNNFGAISNSYSTVNMTGNIYVGGLVGLAWGDISNSYATGTVTGGTFGVGGLVGEHDGGVISNSYATGMVKGADYGVGGLVGGMYGGAISNSYAIGGVSGGNQVGGLVGYHNNSGGTVSTSYATGNVIGTGSNVGGLVGNNAVGTVSIAYATGSVSGISNVGGLVGNNAVGTTVSNAYATGPVSGTGAQGGLVGNNAGTVSNAYATGLVSGTGTKGGLVGNNAGTVSNSFWDAQASGQPTTGIGAGSTTGATGRTTTEMRSIATFSSAGWDIANTGGSGAVWRVYEGSATPWLVWWLKPVTVTLNNDTKIYSGAPYSGGNGYAVGNPDPSLSGTVGSPSPALSGAPAYGGTSQSAVNAGSYAISGSGFYSVQQGYDISYVASTLTINKAHLTVTADDKSRLYGAVNPVLTSTVSGFVNGETASTAASFTGAGSATTLANATTNVGTALITESAGNLSATNYDFAAVNGTLTINKAHLTVTADDKSRLYGEANPTLTSAVSGFVNGETASTAAGYGGVANITTTANATTNVGAVPIAAGAGNLAATNYDFPSLVNGTLTINAAAPVLKPDTQPKPVDSAPAHLQSSILAPQASTKPEEISLSPTLTVTRGSSSDTVAAGDASSSDSGNSSPAEPRWRVAIAGGDASTSGSGNGTVVNTMMTIGSGNGPSLQIVNGGMKLPVKKINVN